MILIEKIEMQKVTLFYNRYTCMIQISRVPIHKPLLYFPQILKESYQEWLGILGKEKQRYTRSPFLS
jgi:hypothetical protein